MSARRQKDIIGPGSIARWSPVAQAYAITPYHPGWSEEVLNAAPVLRVVSSREEAEEEVLGPRSMRVNGVGQEVEQELGEYPEMLDASRFLKPAVLQNIDPPAVYAFRRSGAWMIKTHDLSTAERLSRRAHKNLIGKRSLTAADPYFHHRTLYVAYPGGHFVAPGMLERRV